MTNVVGGSIAFFCSRGGNGRREGGSEWGEIEKGDSIRKRTALSQE